MLDYENYPIIAAVKRKDLEAALASEIQAIFLLSSNIMEIDELTKKTHEKGKLLFIHMDFVDGLSKDAAGVRYLAQKGLDGLISTRSNLILCARELGLCVIQRFFMVDSRSVDTALESIRQTRPDIVEIMPGIAYKAIATVKAHVSVPIIAGGLIDSKEEIYHALAAGASVISTGKRALWDM